ncbi:guanylate kinase [uncultured Enterococcus sp.]|uniref:guanylate kinase n=1 Tax=uncultured Enterococcus sp. TaxID=167972 RepID=UPI002AA90350|nr:guanylate kinase [uncultured Enterococcus sp.]
MTEEGKGYPIFIIMGASGSGKTKMTEQVFPREEKIVSFTTRKRRRNEKNGVDYYFINWNEFEQLITDNQLIEYDLYDGNYYGVGRTEISEKAKKHSVYNVLTLKGFEAISQVFGNQVIPIFLDVSKENILKRLKKRDESEESIRKRSAIYEKDMAIKQRLQKYPNVHIINGDQSIERMVSELREIVEGYEQKS